MNLFIKATNALAKQVPLKIHIIKEKKKRARTCERVKQNQFIKRGSHINIADVPETVAEIYRCFFQLHFCTVILPA